MEQILVVEAVVLIAVLAGAAVLALLQLRRTLRKVETFLETSGVRLNHALDETSEAASKIHLLAAGLERSAAELEKLLGAASRVADSLGELRESLRGVLGGIVAIGPAIAGAIHAVAGRVGEGRGMRLEGTGAGQGPR
jgi:ABC-type transporter Mla subunit MlaD